LGAHASRNSPYGGEVAVVAIDKYNNFAISERENGSDVRLALRQTNIACVGKDLLAHRHVARHENTRDIANHRIMRFKKAEVIITLLYF
jgi:galactokinase/mevalonate kinase-like predicted kinase